MMQEMREKEYKHWCQVLQKVSREGTQSIDGLSDQREEQEYDSRRDSRQQRTQHRRWNKNRECVSFYSLNEV